jgi:hypothetical protein
MVCPSFFSPYYTGKRCVSTPIVAEQGSREWREKNGQNEMTKAYLCQDDNIIVGLTCLSLLIPFLTSYVFGKILPGPEKIALMVLNVVKQTIKTLKRRTGSARNDTATSWRGPTT